MASILDMSASSDSEDDVDYIPSTNVAGSDSSFDEDVTDDDSGELCNKTKKTKKVKQADDDNAHPKSDSTPKVDEKQRAKELWESFLNDVESVAPKSNYAVCDGNGWNGAMVQKAGASESGSKAPKITDSEKPVPKMFEFAGETVIVEKDLNSSDLMEKIDVSTEKPPCQPKRGIDSVLGAIMNKNKKLNVLEKSILDWRQFKNDEGLGNDLEKINKGKSGFIERQRFLERSDVRSYEKEKSLRQTLRKK